MPDDPPSRREILTGHLARPAAEIHISSLVLHCRPEHVGVVRSKLEVIPGVEIHGEAGGKLIVTLETASEGGIVTRMNEIALIKGVLSASLVFHQFEAETAGDASETRG